MEADHTHTAVADTVVVSYRSADLDPTAGDDGFAENHIIHDRIREQPFRAYLRRVHGGPVTEGDEWSEFVNCGCGTTADVVLRVESVDGGSRLDEETVIELVPAGET
jgi:hypothetical protein